MNRIPGLTIITREYPVIKFVFSFAPNQLTDNAHNFTSEPFSHRIIISIKV